MDTTRILERLVSKVDNWDNQAKSAANPQSTDTMPNGQKYDEYDRAAIKGGLAGIVDDKQIPRVYSLFMGTNNVNHHRSNITKGMKCGPIT